MDIKKLILKYSVSGPRYTSYPTAPVWTEAMKLGEYREELVAEEAEPSKPLALYVHVPFCEALCYYCGCNIQITKDHAKGRPYVERLVKELSTVSGLLGERRSLHQISWGGGTPTFLKIDEMKLLHEGIRQSFDIASDAEVSIEIDPRVTSGEQLACLRDLGFNRVSMGLQDFNPKVQEAVNRIQPREMTQAILERARALGFRGINIDLIYGLPFQTPATFSETIRAITEIRPDRIALYNYAHLPNLIKHQRILDSFPMPSPEERVDIFSMNYDYLTRHGYQAIGMDHFALEDDELYRALSAGSLYRNFMGYTVKRGDGMIGVGVSAIGELTSSYFQNAKRVTDYERGIDSEGLATFRGFRLSPEDKKRKWVIQRLMCQFFLPFAEYKKNFSEPFETHFQAELETLAPFYTDGILVRESTGIRVTALGRLFIRNVAMAFDEYLKSPKVTYSKTV